MSSRPKLKTALRTSEYTRPLKDGTVKPVSFDFDFEEVPVINRAFRRMVRNLEFDISEMALTTYICARAHGKPFTAIPVFPVRGLHHGAIKVNTRTGVRTPKDLEGKKVGVNRGYTVTTGVWIRGILQEEYGVDLHRIMWLRSDDEHVTEWVPPENVSQIDEGQNLGEMLASGEIPAAISVDVDSPDVQPLIPDPEEAGFEALRRRGLYPINHTVVIKDELLAERPELAVEVFNCFAEAKKMYVEHLARHGEAETPADRFNRRVMDILGDPAPYGLEPNRQVIETLIRYCLDQRIITRPVTVEELFPANTHQLKA